MKKIIWGIFFILLSLPALSIAEICSIEQKITASDASLSARFGNSVSISGNRAIVGAYYEYGPGRVRESGSAYIFEYTDGTWKEVAKLTPSDGRDSYKHFGYSVSISGNRAIVGAESDDSDGSNYGSAYIFEYIDGTWKEVCKLTAGDGAFQNDMFGYSVSISGHRAIVGALGDVYNRINPFSGAAYIFEYTNGTWKEVAKFTGIISTKIHRDWFGSSVSISGDHAVVGAKCDSDGSYDGYRSGAVYVFDYTDGAWIESVKLTRTYPKRGAAFGRSVAMSGDRFIASDGGVASIYEYTEGIWKRVASLYACGGEANELFGSPVSISDGRAIVGAYAYENLGSAYVFEYTGGTWKQVVKLMASDGAVDDKFGQSVAISGNCAIVGAFNDNNNGSKSGSAYFFIDEIPGDLDGNGIVDKNDYYNVFLPSYGKCVDEEGYNPRCDLNEDNCVTLTDLQILLGQFNTMTLTDPNLLLLKDWSMQCNFDR